MPDGAAVRRFSVFGDDAEAGTKVTLVALTFFAASTPEQGRQRNTARQRRAGDAENRFSLRKSNTPVGNVQNLPLGIDGYGGHMLEKTSQLPDSKILAQPNVLKMAEYCMYFPFSELHGWGKRTACQPQTIYSEVP